MAHAFPPYLPLSPEEHYELGTELQLLIDDLVYRAHSRCDVPARNATRVALEALTALREALQGEFERHFPLEAQGDVYGDAYKARG